MGKPVSIRPDSFKEDNLSDMPIEDVVLRLKGEERVRRDNLDDLSQRSVSVSFRSRPAGLEMLIDELHEHLEVGEQVLTRCMCRQAETWLRSLPLINIVVSSYRITRHNSDGHIDVEEQLKRSNQFNFLASVPVGGSGVTSYSSVVWVRDYFSELSAPLGIPSYRLMLLGLCWSATTNISGVRTASVGKYLRPEVDRFKRHLEEKLLQLSYLGDVLGGR